MAEQLLDAAQVTAGAEQMCGKGVAHGMRGGACGQTQLHPRDAHGFLNQSRP